jgi:hypothetical protein
MIFTLFYTLLFGTSYLTPKLGYSPDVCTPTDYKFTFIFDHNTNTFKTHGIWQETCEECPQCGYPSCCNLDQVNYTDPYDPTNFIPTKWYNTTAHEDCTDGHKVQLFEHEYIKHISCSSDMKTTTEFLDKAIELYDKYYLDYVDGKCEGYDQIWLSLDKNYDYVSTECVK